MFLVMLLNRIYVGKRTVESSTVPLKSKRESLIGSCLWQLVQFFSGRNNREDGPNKGRCQRHRAKRKSVPADMKGALRSADEWFRAATDASLDSLFVAKGVRDEAGQLIDFECIDVNGTALKSLGLAKESVIGQKLWGLLAVNRETLFDKYSQVLSTGSPLEEEFPFNSAETKAKWLRHQVVRAGDGIAVFARDVTLRREAESKLKESEERLRLAMTVAHMGAWTFDPRNQTFSLSEGTGLVFGLPPGEGPRTPGELIEAAHPADRDMLVRVMAESRENATPMRVEFRITWPDGTLHWVNVQSDFIRDEQGVPGRGLGIVMDITERKIAEESRLQIHAELSEAQRIAHMGSWQLDVATNHVTWSEELYRVMGLNPTLPPPDYTEHAKLFTPESWKQLAPAVSRTQETGAPYELELEMARADGGHAWMLVRGEAVRDASGAIVKLRGISMDITERKAAQRTITGLNRVYAVLSGINTLIVRARDRDELFREACRIAVEAGGFRMALIAMVDRNTTKIAPIASASKDEEHLSAIKGLWSLSDTAPNTMTARAIREKEVVVSNDTQDDPRVLFPKLYADAEVRSMAVLPLTVADEAVGVLALYANEIEFFQEQELTLLTELAGDIAFAIDHIEKQEQLNYVAYFDQLTGLANRTLFLDRVAQFMRSATSEGHQLALFLFDLERFRNINDSLGRPVGDELLRQGAQWLTRIAGDANLLARVGSDHFAAVMPVVKQGGDLTRLLDRWMEAFQNHPFCLNDTMLRITFKVGIASFPADGADAETLFRNAEAALKKAKASGERYLFYQQDMTAAVAGKLTLENQLREALHNGEFVLHYQPKVDLANGMVTSAEALIRWNDPRTGLVPPGRFIPMMEETGLIYDVGRWALRQAIKDYLRWRSMGLGAVRIAVNVSPIQLRHRGFIAEIGQAISNDPQAAAGLELEITESVIMEDVKGSIASLQAIRAMGISIAIDDFGTGFSSLAYLAKLPVDTLKIDLSFVHNMTTGPQGLALVSTIISLAHALKLKVVAEGVETEEQLHLLRLLNCDEMQGYLFSKPVPAEIFEAKFLAPASGT